MTHRTFQISVPESNLPKTGNVLFLSESTGQVLGKAAVSEFTDKPMPFLQVWPVFFDMVNATMWKTPAVLKVVAYIMVNLRHRNMIRLKHRESARAIGVSVSTFSRCLATLQKSGLVVHRKDIDVGTYMVNPKAVWQGKSMHIQKAVKEFIEARKASGYFVPESLSDLAGEPTPDTK